MLEVGVLTVESPPFQNHEVTLVKMLVTGLVLALLAGTIVKIKLFGGPQ